ncbi:MAG: hypothetical protein HY852_13995 [Bradyrhizobium sp.]|uniref:hypothetical protein n=1 Tax=Bradyrhizobium sp. TaxID=376 RepID=UPI0025B8B1A0|nr:hypothetical protein [Bradyrhizobium sp.]MBI5262920.1 hypothetical protein [Bradyrhizobium sp.]
MNFQSRTIQIVAVPPGDAPYWVRERWVGLELPLADSEEHRRFLTFGVLSQPRSLWKQLLALLLGRAEVVEGYAVDAAPAVDILGRSSPEAAAWWRENAPRVIAPGRYLVFHAHVCRRA